MAGGDQGLAEGPVEGSEGQLEGSEGQPKGSEGQLEGSEGQPAGSEGQPKRGLMYGQTDGRNFSSFYMTLSPVGATALLPSETLQHQQSRQGNG